MLYYSWKPPMRHGQPGGVGCLPAMLAVAFMLLFLGGIATLAAWVIMDL